MIRVKAIFKIASVYIGTVIGAGFASGQEMVKFFTSYGRNGIIGIILAGILHGIIGAIILEIVYEKKFNSYHEMMREVMGPKLGAIINVTVTTFLFVCFSAMIVGAGAIFNQEFNLPTWVGAVSMAVITTLTFFTGSKGFVRMNSILVPVLCIGGIVLGSYVIIFRDTQVFASVGHNVDGGWKWLFSCINYVAYNTLTVVVVLTSLRQLIYTKSVAKWGGIIGGLGLGMLGLSIGVCTYIYYGTVYNVEIPMLKILSYYPDFLEYIYVVVLILAMYTTAIANGYGVIENITATLKIGKKSVIIVMSLLGLMGVKIGFSNIVQYVFPIFGYIGCFEILMLIVYYSFMKWEKRHKI